MSPVEWMRGKLSGNQLLQYDGGDAYSVPQGDVVTASGYSPRVIAQLRAHGKMRTFQVRTKTTVNATAAYRMNLAVMGGACAIYAAVVRDESSQLYIDCMRAYNAGKVKGQTLRGYIIKKVRPALEVKNALIGLDDNVVLDNPWVTESQNPNVVLSDNIINKFNDLLS